MIHPEEYRAKYPREISDVASALADSCQETFLLAGEQRYAQRERRFQRRETATPSDDYDPEFDYEEYRDLILTRTREEATRQLRVSQDISSHALYGPAAIQAPSTLQMLANNVENPIKQNSTVVTGFEYIKALLNMVAAQGQYFDNLSEVNLLINDFLEIMQKMILIRLFK